MTGKFRVDSKGKNELKAKLAGMKKEYLVKVGVLSSADGELIIITLANEFGAVIKSKKAMRWLFANMRERGITPKPSGGGKKEIVIPERSFIRSTFDDQRIIDRASQIGQKIFNESMSLEKAADAVGLYMENAIRNKMNEDLKPENHPFTIAQKGGGKNTLNATGRLQSAISSEVIK